MKTHATAIHGSIIDDLTKPVSSKEFANQLATVKGETTSTLTGNGTTMKLVSAGKEAAKKPVVKPTIDAQVATPEQPSLAQILAQIAQGAQPTQAQTNGLDAITALTQSITAATQATAATTGTASASTTSSTEKPAAAPDTDLDPLLAKMTAVKPELMQSAPAEPPLTPLEQAVMELLSEKKDAKESDSEAAPVQVSVPVALHLPDAPSVEPAAPVARVHEQPQELVSQNHAHLVFDDPNGRIVMTVAVRGNEVNVTMRSNDDGTTNALARNAATLEDAMRTRGLQLADFSAQRDLAREQSSDKPKYERPDVVKNADGPRFTLEEHS
ncbi:MAG TPA: flagellar hook-length control protein FliK [Kofleriaceae bacterium]